VVRSGVLAGFKFCAAFCRRDRAPDGAKPSRLFAPGRLRMMMRLLPDLCMRNSQGPGSHHAAGRSTVRTCMTSPLYLEPAGETVGRSAFSDRTGSVRRSRICVGTLPATNHNIRSCLSSATGSPESDVRRSTSNGDVHFALLPTAMDDDRRRQLLRPSPSTCMQTSAGRYRRSRTDTRMACTPMCSTGLNTL
jgi:hypothetical protein